MCKKGSTEFILTWYFPNRVRGWIESDIDVERVRNHDYTVVQNYYAKQYTDAWNVAEYLAANNLIKIISIEMKQLTN